MKKLAFEMSLLLLLPSFFFNLNLETMLCQMRIINMCMCLNFATYPR